MTNVNHNPANDFPIGSLGMDNAEDTEGHIVRTYVGEADEVSHPPRGGRHRRPHQADHVGEADEVSHPPRGGRHRRPHQADLRGRGR